MPNAKYTLIAIILFASASLYFTAPAESKTVIETENSEQQTAAPKYALLVGVNRYKPGPKKVGNLYGTHNDVEMMKGLLSERGFKEDVSSAKGRNAGPCGEQTTTSAVKTLCSEQATKKAILETFESHLIKNSSEYWKAKGTAPDPANGPTVVFYYSGHGSQLEDARPIEGETADTLTKEEPDGLDETLVPYDTDTDGTRDIRDDSFELLINRLKEFTQNITFMSDSCHSGTITRGEGMKGFPRSFPNLVVPPTGSRGPATDKTFSDPGYVTISGSLPTQFSFETDLPSAPGKPSQKNGLLTYYFVNFLRANPSASYRDIIGLVRNAIGTTRNQIPQVEGAVERAVFGTSASTGKRGITIKCDGTDNATAVCSKPIEKVDANGSKSIVHRVDLVVGEVVGARVGGPIVVYSPSAPELSGDVGKIGMGTITYADAFTSEAEITLTADKVPMLSKAVLMAPSFSDAKRKVAVDLSGGNNDPGAANMQKLTEALKKSLYLEPTETTGLLQRLDARKTGVRTVAEPVNWEIAVVRGTYKDFKIGREASVAANLAAAKNLTPPDNEIGYFIADKGGLALYDFWTKADRADAVGRIQGAIERHVKALNVRGLKNDATKLQNALQVRMVPVKEYVPRSGGRCDMTAYTPEELKSQLAGTPSIRRNQGFSLEITNTSDKPYLFYIYSIDSAGEIALVYPAPEAREQIRPGGKWSVNSSNPCNLFHFEAAAPTGFEMIKVVVSETEFPADLLTQRGVKDATLRTGGSLLTRLILQARDNTRTTLGSGPVGDWATLDVTYNVVP